MATDREKILQSAQKYVEKKRYDRAIAEYQRIIQEDPNDARTLLKIGDLQSRMEAYPEAIATYDRVGEFYAAQGFHLKAIAVYKQIRELIKKHVPDLADRYGHIVPKLAEIYAHLGLVSDALAAYDEVATRFQRSGRDRDAIEVFQKMVTLDARNPLPHLRLAEACCRVQAVDEALASFWSAAELLLQMERFDDALKVVERMLHFRPDVRFARVAAELYIRRGQREDGLQALAKLQVCFQADPKDLDTLGLLAHAFTLIGQDNKAIEVYKEMARIAREQNRADLFQQLVMHLREVAPNDDQVRALESLAPPSGMPPAGSLVPSSLAPSRRSVSSAESLDDEAVLLDDSASSRHPVVPRIPTPPPRPIMTSAPDVVVVDDEMQAVEERRGPNSFDPSGHARKAIIDAESFRKLRLFSKAVEALHIALEIDPRSLDIRHKLREILVEMGDRDNAIAETLNIAGLHLEQAEPQQAEALIYEVLEIEPEHSLALSMLEQVGQEPYTAETGEGETATRGPEPGFVEDDEQPLPSYDLEGVGAEQALSSERREDFDSPFGGDEPFGEHAPLPSFPLPGTSDDILAGLEAQKESLRNPQIPGTSKLPSFTAKTSDAAALEAIESAPVSGTEAIEEALEEAEFFTSRGLYDDAKSILMEQLAKSPSHPLLLERLREVEAAVQGAAGSGTIERSQLPPPSDRAFDIAASLEALDDLEQEPNQENVGPVGADVDVDQVFAKFKEGVRAQISESDSSTHYDLGLAYREMDLLEDAIGEFELAARDPQRACNCFAMIGMIHLEKNRLDKAAEAYKTALNSEVKTVDQEMSLYYDLGNVQEMKGVAQEALYYFQKIARRDPRYRDIQDRIAALKPGTVPAASSSRAVNDGDEFDQVFDDLFESK